jgi:hypothetical protein
LKFAIECDFNYAESEENYPTELISSLLQNSIFEQQSTTMKPSEVPQEVYCGSDHISYREYQEPKVVSSTEYFSPEVQQVSRRVYVSTSSFLPPGSGSRSSEPRVVKPGFDLEKKLEEERKRDHEEHYDTLCSSKKQIVYPKALPNMLSKLVTVVNVPELSQQVWFETCR